MPLYLFACRKCGHRFEKLMPFARVGEAACEKCGGEVERVYDGAGVFGGRTTKEAQPAPECGRCCPGCPNAKR